jgi:hypothetical protein
MSGLKNIVSRIESVDGAAEEAPLPEPVCGSVPPMSIRWLARRWARSENQSHMSSPSSLSAIRTARKPGSLIARTRIVARPTVVFPNQVRAVPCKVIAPLISPRIKEFDHFTGLRIPGAMFGPLCWLQCRQASARIPARRHMAILTAPFGALPHLADQSLVHELRVVREGSKPDFVKATRAWECITDKTFAMLTYPSNSAFSSGVRSPSLDLSISSCMRARSASLKSMDRR